jgi:hypothetical protein
MPGGVKEGEEGEGVGEMWRVTEMSTVLVVLMLHGYIHLSKFICILLSEVYSKPALPQ